MSYDTEKNGFDPNEKVLRRTHVIRIDRLAELLSQIPEDHFVATNAIGNLSILRGPHFEYVGYIDLGASLLDYFSDNVS